jgi:hypothetical protein
MRSTACSRSTASREVRTTRAPLRAAICAVASPMPLDAPVMTMTCSWTRLSLTLMPPPTRSRPRFASGHATPWSRPWRWSGSPAGGRSHRASRGGGQECRKRQCEPDETPGGQHEHAGHPLRQRPERCLPRGPAQEAGPAKRRPRRRCPRRGVREHSRPDGSHQRHRPPARAHGGHRDDQSQQERSNDGPHGASTRRELAATSAGIRGSRNVSS